MNFKKVFCFSIVTTMMISGLNTYAGSQDWPGYANTATHHSIAVDGPNTIDSNTLAWKANTSPQGLAEFEFESATGPILYNGIVYAYAKYLEPNESEPSEFDQTGSQLVAYDANSGQLLWNTVIDPAAWGSRPSPTFDSKHNNLLIGSGNVTADGMYALPGKVYAIDAATGTIEWETLLDTCILNSSICVAADLPYARAFITDYFGFGTSGKLYCINLEANEPGNPYEPGQIIWSDVLGATNGNSPAYKDGVVYVSRNSYAYNPSYSYGAIYAYDANATSAVRLWEASDPNLDGFGSGVTVTKEGFVYAVGYDYSDEVENNSTFCKIDCNDGSIVWITQAERTNSMPVVVGDRIYISGGVDGWGSRPKVQAYQDLGGSVVKLWETPAELTVGGWANQPAYANGKLYVGAMPTDSGSSSEMYILDAIAGYGDPNFIIAHYDANECGNSPAVTCDSVYTIGSDGLFKFYQPALLADIEEDGRVDGYDLAELADCWLYDRPIGILRADLNLDGIIDFSDFMLLAEQWYGELD